MTVTVTCDECEHRMRLERKFWWPQKVLLICHECETPIVGVLTWDAFSHWPTRVAA